MKSATAMNSSWWARNGLGQVGDEHDRAFEDGDQVPPPSVPA